MSSKFSANTQKLTALPRKLAVTVVTCLAILLAGCDDSQLEIKQLQGKVTNLEQAQASLMATNNSLSHSNARLNGFIDSQKSTIKSLNSTNSMLLNRLTNIAPVSCGSNSQEIQALHSKLEELNIACHGQQKALEQSFANIENARRGGQNTTDQPVPDQPAPDLTLDPAPNQETKPTPAPCGQGGINNCGDDHTVDTLNDDNDEQRQMMMMAAFVACTYYSAGTCAFWTSAIGLNFGMSGEEVKQEMQTTWDNASNDLRNKKFKIPGPNGKPIILSVSSAEMAMEAIEAVNNMPVADRLNACKLLTTLKQTEIGKEYQLDRIRLYGFPSQINKDNVLKVMNSIRPDIADQLGKIPVKGQGITPCQAI